MSEEQLEPNADKGQEKIAKSDVEIKNIDNTAIPKQEDLIQNKQSFIASGNNAQFQQIFLTPSYMETMPTAYSECVKPMLEKEMIPISNIIWRMRQNSWHLLRYTVGTNISSTRLFFVYLTMS